MVFDYYYGIEAEQFTFLRIPKVLFTEERFKGLSLEAKVLYGLLLERLSLSMKNGWLDDDNRVFIHYTLENIMEDLGYSSGKCVKIMQELDDKKGIGLIERKKQGLGKPDIIYVKNFLKLIGEKENEPSKSAGTEDLQNLQVKTFSVDKSEVASDETAGFQNLKANNTDIKHIEFSNTESFNPSGESTATIHSEGMDEIDSYKQLIRDNIEYDHHMKYGGIRDKELYQELYELICDIVCVRRKTVHIGKTDYPYEVVKSRFLKLDSNHLEYVIESLNNTTSEIRDIKAYLLTALYNAPSTINTYWTQRVQHDMYGCG